MGVRPERWSEVHSRQWVSAFGMGAGLQPLRGPIGHAAAADDSPATTTQHRVVFHALWTRNAEPCKHCSIAVANRAKEDQRVQRKDQTARADQTEAATKKSRAESREEAICAAAAEAVCTTGAEEGASASAAKAEANVMAE